MTGRPEPSPAVLSGHGLKSNLVPASIIDPETIQAYLETEYRVLGEQCLTLQVGQACPGLFALHRRHKVECSAFLTACNPFSQRCDEAANAVRQEALASELTRRSLAFVPGIGEHPSRRWPGEDSLLVFGLDLESAKILGARYEQNGLIWSGADGVPQLILLR